MKFKALITGITGQDGSYLAEFLLKKKYIVHGIKRKSSSFNTSRIDHIYDNKEYKNKFFLHYGDLLDSNSGLIKIIKSVKPNEIYNLAAQSHVGVSLASAAKLYNAGEFNWALNLRAGAIKDCGLSDKTKFYQASRFWRNTRKKQSGKKQNSIPRALMQLQSYLLIDYKKLQSSL